MMVSTIWLGPTLRNGLIERALTGTEKTSRKWVQTLSIDGKTFAFFATTRERVGCKKQEYGVNVRYPDREHASWIAGLGFDASIWELFPYLTAGACIHIPEDHVRVSADALRAWLVEQSITIAFAPTPLAEMLISAPCG